MIKATVRALQGAARLALLCGSTCPILLFAGDKTYPLEGKVVALGTAQELTGGGATPVVNGTGAGSTPILTMVHRTYTVKSPSRVYVLECPFWMNGFHIHSPSECGGSKKITIGDVIHFRIAKNRAYISIDQGKEQKLSVLSEASTEAPGKEETNP